MSRLFVVRHGNTFETYEPARRIGARTDLPLTREGEAQASRLGSTLRQMGVSFGHALTGPLRRAQVTARLILTAMAETTPLSIEPMLDEIDHGLDEGLAEHEVLARHGWAALDQWDTRARAPAGWTVDAPKRLAWWRGLLALPPAGDTLIVTSNGAARFALLTLPTEVRPVAMKLRTGAFGLIESDGNCGWKVDRWNERPADPTGQ